MANQKPKYFNYKITINNKICKKEKYVIYIKQFKYIVFLTIFNFKIVIYKFIKKKLLEDFQKILYDIYN